MRPRAALAALILLTLAMPPVLSGCSSKSKTVDQQQMDEANMRADVSSLKSTSQELRKRMEDVESVLGRKERGFTLEDVNRKLAQMDQALSRMSARLGMDYNSAPASGSSASPVGGPAGNGTYGATQAQAPAAEPAYSTAPGAPSVGASQAQPYQPGQYQPGQYQGGQQVQYARPSEPPAGPIEMGSDGSDPAEAVYNMGMEAYNRREYGRAITLFTELQKSYPSSRQAPSALFWQAQSLYQEGDYARAALVCQDLIAKHPRHPMVPSAMLRQAQCFRMLGKTQAARILLQDVERRFPGSPEAVSAQAALKEMR